MLNFGVDWWWPTSLTFTLEFLWTTLKKLFGGMLVVNLPEY